MTTVPPIAPQFVCLSMIVSGRAWHNAETFSVPDGVAYALQRENEPGEHLPPLVLKSLQIYGMPRP